MGSRPLRRRVVRATAWLALAGPILWLLGMAGARLLVVRLPLAHPDALVVLSGAPVYGERLAHAAQMFLQQPAGATLILTNDGGRRAWSRRLQRNPSSIEVALETLAAAGVPSHSIVVLPGIVRGTIDEAEAVRLYAVQQQLHTVVGVTSPYHTRRTLWTFQTVLGRQGVQVGIEPVPFNGLTPTPAWWWTRAAGWDALAGELVKLPYYWWNYR